MDGSQETSWTLIEAAASGDAAARSRFTSRYLPVARAYLGARWSGQPHLAAELDDAVQEVFLDCFREGGALERADPGKGRGFRAFFYGILANVALRFEDRRGGQWRRAEGSFHPERIAVDDPSLSKVFDREWARAVMREAAELQTRRARETSPEALRRVELLHLRFHEDLPIRAIAKLWKADPARLHHDYALARKEFLDALKEVIGLQERCPPDRLSEECNRLLEILE